MKNSTKYPLAIRLLHWLMAITLIAMLVLGNSMSGLSRDDALRPQLYDLHKAIGVTLLGFALLRVVLRLILGVPAEPDAIPRREQWLARFAHWGAYGLMFAIPLSGIIMTNAFGFTVHWFAGIAVPKIVGVDKALGSIARDAHGILANLLIIFIVLHIAGVVKHYVVEKINLLLRMI